MMRVKYVNGPLHGQDAEILTRGGALSLWRNSVGEQLTAHTGNRLFIDGQSLYRKNREIINGRVVTTYVWTDPPPILRRKAT